MTISGKNAIVTGAGTGIGRGVALELAKRGASVAVHYNSSEAGAFQTKRLIDEAGGSCITVKANVASKEEIDRMVETVADRFGRIDILVSNAALQLNLDLFGHDDDTYDRTMNTNVKGYWQTIQAVVPHMKSRNHGRIILVSSVHSKRPTDFDPIYAMSKGAIRMLGRESAIELAGYGITVNMIEPGAIDVGKFRTGSAQSPELFKKFPGGRVGLPSDVAELVCYIAGDATSFMTGTAIRLDGASMLL
ncbi:SDR family NAD(P)-dependent oxidoreductase [Cohnella luojiensis]|uniref:SDR family oxidoreductase n=1 Tax=Cohnella luojiensis TaxID=652876 RepID=A0A4Y8LRW0_9BACL|nr:SDR family oxidoreductase [Cohnella luojiensis]TFE23466.1 SDR family oxidoreductase [Cohnella luojiensis]